MKQLIILFLIIPSLILTYSCNKGVIDFEDRKDKDNLDTTQIVTSNPSFCIDNVKPVEMKYYPYYGTDSTNIWDYRFHFKINGDIDTIYLGNYPIKYFIYELNSISLVTINGGDDTKKAYLSNSRVDSIWTVSDNLHYYTNIYKYDIMNNLIKMSNNRDSNFYQYANGNMSDNQHYSGAMNIFNNIYRHYDYYDTIMNDNSWFFPFSDYDSYAGTGSGYFELLNRFGNHNLNLLKSRILTSDGVVATDTLKYLWTIIDARITELKIIRFDKVWEKVVYSY